MIRCIQIFRDSKQTVSDVNGLRMVRFILSFTVLNEPRHEKTCLCHMRTTKAQISLRIRPV